MGKAPADQWYWNDWMRDTRPLSLAAKGAWIDLLGEMWYAQTRGVLCLTWVGYSRLIGATVDQTKAAISELIDMQICDYRIENDNEKSTPVMLCNEKVTLINRRMYREYKDKENNKKRVERHRMKRFSNADVTPPSSNLLKTSTSKPPHPTLSPDLQNGPGRGGEIFDCVKGFEEFFKAYPKSKFRMTAKIPAEYAYAELIKTAEQHAALMAGLARHKGTDQWRDLDGKFVPNPERFLRECRWQDVAGDEGEEKPKKKRLKKPAVERCGKCGAEYGFLFQEDLEEFRKAGGCRRCEGGEAAGIDGEHAGAVMEFLDGFGKREKQPSRSPLTGGGGKKQTGL